MSVELTNYEDRIAYEMGSFLCALGYHSRNDSFTVSKGPSHQFSYQDLPLHTYGCRLPVRLSSQRPCYLSLTSFRTAAASIVRTALSGALLEIDVTCMSILLVLATIKEK